MTQFHIGCKQIEAWEQEHEDGRPGYAVKYPDGYVSWSPKDVFEKAYLPMGYKTIGPDEPEEINPDTITQKMVDDFITEVETKTWGEKTTIVKATLANGFILTESSSCVDPANYCEVTGKQICLERINNRVWLLLGFLLQTARNGVQPQ